MIKKETRGRKSLPPEQHKPPQKVVKVNEAILPLVLELKGYLRNNKLPPDTIKSLFDVLHRKPERSHAPANTIDILGENKVLQERINELTIKSNKEVIKVAALEGKLEQLHQKPSDSNVISLNQYKEANIKLVQNYDRECLKGVQMQGQIRSKDSTIKSLNQEVERLKHLEHGCQALTKSGTRCTRPSKVKIQYKGIEINTCLQHREIKS